MFRQSLLLLAFLQVATAASIDPSRLPATGTVDERYQSFNIEMVEVTGGRFWRPYADQGKPAENTANTNIPAGMDPSLYEYRAPADLTNARLRKLAAALAPSYVRVSGTWANSSYFQNTDAPAGKVPEGFNAVLTRQQWKGVVDFSKATDAKIVTSFATSPGARFQGNWIPEQATQILNYTKSLGGTIAAAEFMNEPTIAEMGGAPKGYSAENYGKDFAVFHYWAKQADPNMIILGPGSVGEGASPISATAMHILASEELLKASAPNNVDAFSYHFYPGVSKRCASRMGSPQITPESTLSEEYLARADQTDAFYGTLRDRYQPGNPLWITETAEAACGGDTFAATFIDSFRYLDQLGRHAQHGVQVIAHNTLAASDYGLLDEKTMNPRPDYWSALLWRKLMGTKVLNPGPSSSERLHLYAHCLRGSKGGVALLAINTDSAASHDLDLTTKSSIFALTAKTLDATTVELNGTELKLGSDDSLPKLAGKSTNKGQVTLAPTTIAFFAISNANNASCR